MPQPLQVVYAQATVTPTDADLATVAALELNGWEVQTIVGTLSGVADWGAIAFIVFGHRTSHHPDSAATLDTYPVDKISLSRHVNIRLGFTTGLYGTVTVESLTLIDPSHELAMGAELAGTSQAANRVTFIGLANGCEAVYVRSGTEDVVIAQRAVGAMTYRMFGEYQLQYASEPLLDLFRVATYGYARRFSQPIGGLSLLGQPQATGSATVAGEASADILHPGGYGVLTVEGATSGIQLFGTPVSNKAPAGRLLFYRRYADGPNENRIIDLFLEYDWYVEAPFHTLAGTEGKQFDVLIIGVNILSVGTRPPDEAALAALDIPLHITLCPSTAVLTYGMAGSYSSQTASSFQKTGTDPTSTRLSVSFVSSSYPYLFSLTTGTEAHYTAMFSTRHGVCARALSEGRKVVFFGHSVNSDSVPEVLDLLAHYAGVYPAPVVSMGASEVHLMGDYGTGVGYIAPLGAASAVFELQPVAQGIGYESTFGVVSGVNLSGYPVASGFAGGVVGAYISAGTVLGRPTARSLQTKRTAVFQQRNATLQNYDVSTIAALEDRGWVVTIDVQTFPERDWDDIGLFVIGAPGTAYISPYGIADIGQKPVPIMSMCRAATRFIEGGYGYNSSGTTLLRINRSREDERAPYEQIEVPSQVSQLVWLEEDDDRAIYRQDGLPLRVAVAEGVRTVGYPLVHWSYHRTDVASPELMEVFHRFLAGLETWVSARPISGVSLLSEPTTQGGMVVQGVVSDIQLLQTPTAEGPYAIGAADGIGTVLAAPVGIERVESARPVYPPARFAVTYVAVEGGIAKVYTEGEDGVFVGQELAGEAEYATNRASRSSWSPDGRLFAMSHGGRPHITVFKYAEKLSEEVSGTVVPTMDLGTNVSQFPRAVRWSPDGQHLLVAAQSTPGARLYGYTEDGLVPVSIVGFNHSGTCPDCCWHPSGDYFAVTRFSSLAQPFFFGKKVGGVFSLISNVLSYYRQSSGEQLDSISWSPDGKYLAISYFGGSSVETWYSGVRLYSWDSDADYGTLIPAGLPDAFPAMPWAELGWPRAVAWSSDGKYVAIGTSGESLAIPYRLLIFAISWEGEEMRLTQLPDAPLSIGGSIFDISWMMGSKYLLIAHQISPRVTVLDMGYYNPMTDRWSV